jgi:glycosyltransferase involved in cell wall biosynthesis
MTKTPDSHERVAVVIPCFNDGPLVRAAVESVAEPEPVELVVVDDCSEDAETLRVLGGLEAHGVRVLHAEKNRGAAGARSIGLRATSARFVFPLDADDLAIAGTITDMADCLDRHPRAAACFGDYAEFGDTNLVRAVPDRLDPYRIAYTNEYPISSLFRRTVLEEIGGWEGNGYAETGYEDWNLWMTLAERADECVHLGHGRLTYRRRLHGPRKLTESKRKHPRLYQELKRTHPDLFADLPRHRRESDMSRIRKWLYPVVYGGRRRFAAERHVKAALDRAGIWTLRR